MAKEHEFVYAEQIFDITVFLKEGDNVEKIEKTQLKHIPKKGDYFIPLGCKEAFLIEAILHDDLETYIVVNNLDTTYNNIAANRYKDPKAT